MVTTRGAAGTTTALAGTAHADAARTGTAHTGTARTTTALAVVLWTAVLAGCQTPGDTSAGDTGGPGDTPVSTEDRPGATPTPSPTSPAPSSVTADLTIVVDATGEGATETYTLTCGPEGGHHPEPAGACAAIAAGGGVDAFAPTPRDVACTEQWGGPQKATVQGTVDGQQVDAAFDRTDGCEISRWDRLAVLFGPGGGLL